MRNGPIPENLEDEFEGWMSVADDDDLPDGAHWQMLQDSAQGFLETHKLPGDSHDAAMQYLGIKERENDRRDNS